MKANIARLVLLAAVWGGSFLFMRIGAPVFGPPMLIELRVGIAALFLLEVAWWSGRALPDLRHWRHYVVMGLFNATLPFLAFAYAAQTLPASLLSILNATAPMFGALAAALWLGTPITRAAALGMALGISGVAVLAGADMPLGDGGSQHWWLAVAAALAAPLSYGIAGVYANVQARAAEPFDTAHGSMWAATLMVLPLLWIAPVHAEPGWGDWGAVGALGVLCTGAAFLVYFRLLRDVGPVRALSVTFLIPAFGVLWGALFLDEPLGWNTLAGGLLILLGTGLTNGVIKLSRLRTVGQRG